MDIFALIIYFLTFLAAVVLGLRYYTHMLQLSSYQFQGYFRFLKSKPQRYGLHVGYFFTTIFAALTKEKTSQIFLAISFLFLVFLIIQYLPKKAKKKFVVTQRVLRLFVTYAVLYAVFMLFALILDYWVIAVFMGFLPLITALANLINKPIEQKVNEWFIKDAQRILAEHPGLRIIGITGSYGKTSVKYYLHTLLSEGYRVLMTPESFNTPMGVVRTIRENLTPMHEVFICEMGARHVHDIKEITDIVHPDDGILTSIGPQHLETFHSLENIISTKYELFDAVVKKQKAAGNQTGAVENTTENDSQSTDGGNDNKSTGSTTDNADKSKTGLMFANGDNEIITSNKRHEGVIYYGTSEGCDYRATDVTYSAEGASFKVTAPNGETAEFTMKLLGEHNVANVVGAIAMAHTLGIPMSKLKMAVRRIAPAPHRQELKRHGNVAIIDDAYNSNPMGAKMACNTLSKFTDHVRILVTPGMVELGEKEEEYNREFGVQAAAAADYIILVGADHTRPIKEGALSAGFSEDRLFVKDTIDEAIILMNEIDAGKQKVILLENDLPDNY